MVLIRKVRGLLNDRCLSFGRLPLLRLHIHLAFALYPPKHQSIRAKSLICFQCQKPMQAPPQGSIPVASPSHKTKSTFVSVERIKLKCIFHSSWPPTNYNNGFKNMLLNTAPKHSKCFTIFGRRRLPCLPRGFVELSSGFERLVGN